MSTTLAPATLAPVVSTLEKLALNFITSHPSLIGNFLGHAVSKIAGDVATKQGVTLTPEVSAEIESAVADILAALVPVIVQAAAGK
jgi:hypothetical protein